MNTFFLAATTAARDQRRSRATGRGARNLHDAHTEWHALAAEVGALIRHLHGVHSPSDHALEPVARDVRTFLRQTDEIAPALPTRPSVRRVEMPEVAA